MFGEISGLYEPVTNEYDPRRFTIESAIALMAATFVSYVFTFEGHAMPPTFRKTFSHGTGMNADEKSIFDAFRAVREIERRMQKH